MSLPCGYKSNTETVAQYRKRCGPRPLGMIGKMSESDVKTIHKLLTMYGKSASKATSMIKKNYRKVAKQFRGDSPRDLAMALLGYDSIGENKRKPRKKGQPAGSKKHSDLYTDENPKGTIHGLKFATVKDAQKSVSKIKGSGKTHAHKIQAAIAMEQRAKAAGKKTAAGVYRKFINQMKKKTKQRNEGWSDKYKRSIDCNNPKGFSQKAHCAGRKKRESIMNKILTVEERINLFVEKNVPTNPSKWAYYKGQAKKKFDVYPSAYANAWAAKQYKAAGGGWRKVKG